MNTEEIVHKVIKKNRGLSKKVNLSDTDNIYSDLGLDSLDVLEMVMEIEDIFNISISDEKVIELNTVGEITRYINTVREAQEKENGI